MVKGSFLSRGALGLVALLAIALAACAPKTTPPTSATAMPGTTQQPQASNQAPKSKFDEHLAKYPAALPCKPGEDQGKRGGTLRLASPNDPPHYDPTYATVSGLTQMAGAVYDRLMDIRHGCKMDPYKTQIDPLVAQSWDIAPDGLTWTFHIKQGIKWQNVPPLNGRELTAEDLVFTYKRFRDEKGSVHASNYAAVKDITAPDKYTLKFTLSEPAPYLFPYLASQYAFILPPEIAKEDGDFKKRMIGSGPFMLKEVMEKDHIFFTRNPDYHQQPLPYVDDYKIFIVKDDATRIAGIRSGQFDVIFGGPSLDNLDAILKTNPDMRVQGTEPFRSTFAVAMRQDLPNLPYKDVNVRRALNMGFDRKAISEGLTKGMATPMIYIPWPYALDKRPTVEDMGPYYQYNPAEAKKLLAQAGYPNGFKATATYYVYSPNIPQTLQIIQQQWKDIGVDLQIKEEDYVAYNDKLFKAQFDDMTYAWPSFGFDPDSFTYQLFHSQSPQNRFAVKDPELDKLLVAQRKEVDPAKRRVVLKQIWDMVRDNAYVLPEVVAPGQTITPPWVNNYRTTQFELGPTDLVNSAYHVKSIWLGDDAPGRKGQ